MTTKLFSVLFLHNFQLFKDFKNMSFLAYSLGIVKSCRGHFDDTKEEGKLGPAETTPLVVFSPRNCQGFTCVCRSADTCSHEVSAKTGKHMIYYLRGDI